MAQCQNVKHTNYLAPTLSTTVVKICRITNFGTPKLETEFSMKLGKLEILRNSNISIGMTSQGRGQCHKTIFIIKLLCKMVFFYSEE